MCSCSICIADRPALLRLVNCRFDPRGWAATARARLAGPTPPAPGLVVVDGVVVGEPPVVDEIEEKWSEKYSFFIAVFLTVVSVHFFVHFCVAFVFTLCWPGLVGTSKGCLWAVVRGACRHCKARGTVLGLTE